MIKFRLYERGINSGGAVIKSSGSGGDSVQTSSNGGGATVTSAAGGGTTVTSSSYVQQSLMSGVPENSVGTDNWGYHLHEVVVPGHDHSVTISNHSHSVSVPSHSHSVNTPAHTHEINIPDHSHGIEFGIFELDRTATAVTIEVDGNPIPFSGTSGDKIDLIPYLSKDSDGKINRGWHEVTITPNDLARITANIYSQFYIQSRGGGSY